MRAINRRLRLSEPACFFEVVAAPGVTWGALEKESSCSRVAFSASGNLSSRARDLQSEGWALVKEPHVPPLADGA